MPYVLKEPDYDWDGAPVSDRTKLMIFNNPNNPTGKVFSAEEMRDAADFVKKHDLLAISDEAYDRLLYGDARHVRWPPSPTCANAPSSSARYPKPIP